MKEHESQYPVLNSSMAEPRAKLASITREKTIGMIHATRDLHLQNKFALSLADC